MEGLYIILILLIVINYGYYYQALIKTYDYHTTGGVDVYHGDLYFKTRKEAFKHAIPFYFYYLALVKIYKAFKELN
jgi:hypothetical protein